MQVEVACATRVPRSSVSLASATATRPPRDTMLPSQRSRPDPVVTGLMNRVLRSSEV